MISIEDLQTELSLMNAGDFKAAAPQIALRLVARVAEQPNDRAIWGKTMLCAAAQQSDEELSEQAIMLLAMASHGAH